MEPQAGPTDALNPTDRSIPPHQQPKHAALFGVTAIEARSSYIQLQEKSC